MRWKPTAAVLASSAVFCLMLIMSSVAFLESQHQRRASCRATLIALDAVAATSSAGIRSVPASLNPDNPLAKLFDQQRQATRMENARRRAVIVRTNQAAADLRQSDFCKR